MTSAALTAFMIIKSEKMHCDTLGEAIELMKLIKTRAVIYLEPFDSIMSDICERLSFPLLNLSADCFLSCKKSVPNAWIAAIEAAKMHLGDDEKNILISYGTALCTCPKEETEVLAETKIEQMNAILTRYKSNLEKKQKLTSALIVSAAVTVVMILI